MWWRSSVDDLTPLLRRLSDEHVEMAADGRRVERHRHPRACDALVIGLKEARDLGPAAQIAKVMPKGRNFH